MAIGKSLGALTAQVGADTSDWDQAMRNMRRDMKRLSKRGAVMSRSLGRSFQSVGQSMKRTGMALSKYVAVPLAVAGAASAKFAADYETALTQVITLTNASQKQVEGWSESIMDMTHNLAKSPVELAQGLLAVTSAGLTGKKTLNTLTSAAKAAAIGLGKTKEVARALTGIMQSYAETNLTAAHATNLLVGIVKQGNVEASELAPKLGRVTGIAAQLGVSFKEVAANLATFTRLGVPASVAITGLRAVLSSFMQQTNQATEALKSIGMSFQDLYNMLHEKGLTRTLIFLTKAFKGNKKAMSSLFGSIRGLADVLGTAGSQTKTYIQISHNLSKVVGNLNKPFQRVANTVQFQFNQALADAQKALIDLGKTIRPVTTKVLNFVSTLANAFTGMSDTVTTAILSVAGIIGIGGVFATALGFMIEKIGVLMEAIPKLIELLGKWKDALLAIKAVRFGALLGAVGLVIGGLAIAAHNAMEKSKELNHALKHMANLSNNEVQKAIEGVRDRIEKLKISLANPDIRGSWAEHIKNILAKQKALLDDLIKKKKKYLKSKFNIGVPFKRHFGPVQRTLFNVSHPSVIVAPWQNLTQTAKQAKDSINNATQALKDFKKVSLSIAPPSFDVIGISPNIGSQFKEISFADKLFPPGSVGAIKNRIQGIRDSLSTMTSRFQVVGALKKIRKLKQKLADLGIVSVRTGKQINKIFGRAINNMIVSFAKGIGKIAAGTESFKEVGLRLLKMLGQMAIQIGSLFITLGSAVASALNPATLFATLGGSALVAGAALIAAGAALMGIVGALGAGSSSSDVGGGFGGIAPGMAEGGIVPEGFPNDSYPALLTSGEMVVPEPKPLPSGGGLSKESMKQAFKEALSEARWRVDGDQLIMTINNTKSGTYR